MSSDKFTWISTDRKTEPEVLKELVAADTPVVIVSRDEADEQILHRVMKRQYPAQSVILLEVHPDSTKRKFLRPGCLERLLESPWEYVRITDVSLNPTERLTPPHPLTLRDWLVRRVQSPSDPSFVMSNDEFASRRTQLRLLGEPSRPAIVASPSKLTASFRAEIEQFAKSEVGYGDFNGIAQRAAVYLWHDLMDESHELAQSIEGKGWNLNGDYVHAILHRREPDYSNAKYWFRHVGRHPNFDRLGQEAGPLIEQHAPEWKSRLLKGGWDPLAFVDFCEQAVATKNSPWTECAELIQEIELLLLLNSTAQQAHV